MKTLHFIRHAKSSWKSTHLADHDRPLNKRGEYSCELMSQEIVKLGCDFKNVYTSSAVRAQSTIQLLSTHVQSDFHWSTDERLYTFESDVLLDWCINLDESLSSVVVVGHNPAITELVTYLTGEFFGNVPTCGYVQLTLKNGQWNDLESESMDLQYFIYPKKFGR